MRLGPGKEALLGFVEGALKRERGHQASVFVAACRYCWSLPPCGPKLPAHDTTCCFSASIHSIQHGFRDACEAIPSGEKT